MTTPDPQAVAAAIAEALTDQHLHHHTDPNMALTADQLIRINAAGITARLLTALDLTELGEADVVTILITQTGRLATYLHDGTP